MIAVVDSGVANLTSVMCALQRLGANAEITFDANKIAAAEKVIVPGVGAAAPAMRQMRDKNLTGALRALKQPVLGICLGMQLLFTRSLEGQQPVECLNILPGEVRPLPFAPDAPIPHMGWNQIDPAVKDHPLLRGINKGDYVYFVHSFAAPRGDYTLATTDYGATFTSVAGARNFYGCQFHPERSGTIGSKIIENFLRI